MTVSHLWYASTVLLYDIRIIFLQILICRYNGNTYSNPLGSQDFEQFNKDSLAFLALHRVANLCNTTTYDPTGFHSSFAFFHVLILRC